VEPDPFQAELLFSQNNEAADIQRYSPMFIPMSNKPPSPNYKQFL
jgi:hypothetical protein